VRREGGRRGSGQAGQRDRGGLQDRPGTGGQRGPGGDRAPPPWKRSPSTNGEKNRRGESYEEENERRRFYTEQTERQEKLDKWRKPRQIKETPKWKTHERTDDGTLVQKSTGLAEQEDEVDDIGSDNTFQPDWSYSDNGDVATFAGIQLAGNCASFLRNMSRLGRGTMEPTDIQALCMKPILQGQNVMIHAPTGSGKSLAFMLPLIQRLMNIASRKDELKRKSNLRMVIVAPSQTLVVQLCALARALVGPELAEQVTIVQTGGANQVSSIVVGTAQGFMDLLWDANTGPIWATAVGWIDMVVFDEADRLVFLPKRRWDELLDEEEAMMRPPSHGRDLLSVIHSVTRENRRSFQLVAASATSGRKTERTLTLFAGLNDAGRDLILLRAAGAEMPKTAKVAAGQYGDGSSTLPLDTVHTIRVVEQMENSEARFGLVMEAVVKTIVELKARRTLLVICQDDGPNALYSRGDFGMAAVSGYLQFALADYNIEVENVLRVVEKASAKVWTSGGADDGRKADDDGQEVIVAAKNQIRGIHLAGLEAVVLIGDPASSHDYVHCAGRTNRMMPGKTRTMGGICVSVVSERVADEICKYGSYEGFQTRDVPLSEVHPSVWDEIERVTGSMPKEAEKVQKVIRKNEQKREVKFRAQALVLDSISSQEGLVAFERAFDEKEGAFSDGSQEGWEDQDDDDDKEPPASRPAGQRAKEDAPPKRRPERRPSASFLRSEEEPATGIGAWDD